MYKILRFHLEKISGRNVKKKMVPGYVIRHFYSHGQKADS